MKFRSPAQYAVLGLLIQGPKHGYEIHQDFGSDLGRIWYLGTSQIYALLNRLEEEGKVESTAQLQKRRPPKRVFSLTPAGQNMFMDWVQRPLKNIRDLRVEFLTKLFFIRELQLDNGLDLIDEQIQICQQKRNGIERSFQEMHDEFQRLVLRFRVTQIDAIISWLWDCRSCYGMHRRENIQGRRNLHQRRDDARVDGP